MGKAVNRDALSGTHACVCVRLNITGHFVAVNHPLLAAEVAFTVRVINPLPDKAAAILKHERTMPNPHVTRPTAGLHGAAGVSQHTMTRPRVVLPFAVIHVAARTRVHPTPAPAPIDEFPVVTVTLGKLQAATAARTALRVGGPAVDEPGEGYGDDGRGRLVGWRGGGGGAGCDAGDLAAAEGACRVETLGCR